jgi:hypothetical protein
MFPADVAGRARQLDLFTEKDHRGTEANTE